MRRKYLVGALTLTLLIVLALPALAAYSDNQAQELAGLFAEKEAIQMRILDQQVEMDLITEEEADRAKERITKISEHREERILSGEYTPRQRGARVRRLLQRKLRDGSGESPRDDCPFISEAPVTEN